MSAYDWMIPIGRERDARAELALVDCGDVAHIVRRHSSGVSAVDFASLAERLGGRVQAQVLCGGRVVIFGHAHDDQDACRECVTRWRGEA